MDRSVSSVFVFAQLLAAAKLRSCDHDKLIDFCECAIDGGAQTPPTPGSWSSPFERRAAWAVMTKILFEEDSNRDIGWDNRLFRIEAIIARQPDALELMVGGLLDPGLELYDDSLHNTVEDVLARDVALLPRYFAEVERLLPLCPRRLKLMVEIATNAAERQETALSPETKTLLKKWKRLARKQS